MTEKISITKNTKRFDGSRYASLLNYIKSKIKGLKIYTTNSSDVSPVQMLSGKDLKKYVIPHKCKVPSGRYVSTVMYAETDWTSGGKEAVMVYYKIKQIPSTSSNGCKKTPAKTYYIKHFYPDGKKSFNDFLDSMAEALGTESYSLKDTIGVTEYVTLSYYRNNSVGRYSKRSPMTM